MVLNLLPGGPLAPGTLATGRPCSNSLAGPSSSVLVGLPAVPANMASRQLSELFYGSGIYFELQPGLCSVMPAKCLAAGATLLWAAACFESPRKKSAGGGGGLGLVRVMSEPQEPGFFLGVRQSHGRKMGGEIRRNGEYHQGVRWRVLQRGKRGLAGSGLRCGIHAPMSSFQPAQP